MSYPNVIADYDILCRIDSCSRLIQNGMGISRSDHDFGGKQAVISDRTLCGFGNGNMDLPLKARIIGNYDCIIFILRIKGGAFGNAVLAEIYCVVATEENKFAVKVYPPRKTRWLPFPVLLM